MVHADHRIISPLGGEVEQGVGAVGSAGRHPRGPGGGDGRCDQPRFLVAEQTRLAGVRVEGQHGDARRLQAEVALEGCIGDADGGEDLFTGQNLWHLSQSQMGGDQADLEPLAGQHHHHLLHPAAGRQQLGVTREIITGGMDRRLVDRGGDHAGGRAALAAVAGPLDVIGHGPPACGGGPAVVQLGGGEGGEGVDRKAAPCDGQTMADQTGAVRNRTGRGENRRGPLQHPGVTGHQQRAG